MTTPVQQVDSGNAPHNNSIRPPEAWLTSHSDNPKAAPRTKIGNPKFLSLMSYGPSLGECFKRNAVFIDKILKGAKPADPPVEQPTKFDFVVNLKAAHQISLTIPPNLLVRASQVIR